jgi:hypothetical protein
MDTPEQLITAVTEQLAKLATHGSADQIRDFFEAEEIKGIRGSATSCPVANYLIRQVGEHYITVGRGTTSVIIPGHSTQVTHPPEVNSFIDRFDLGQFAELVAL